MGADKNEDTKMTDKKETGHHEEFYMGGYNQEMTWESIIDAKDKTTMGLRVGKMKPSSFPEEHRGNPCIVLYFRTDRPSLPCETCVIPLSWHWVRKVEWTYGTCWLTLQHTCYRTKVQADPFTGEAMSGEGSNGLKARVMQLVEWVKDDLAFEGSSGLGMDKKEEVEKVSNLPNVTVTPQSNAMPLPHQSIAVTSEMLSTLFHPSVPAVDKVAVNPAMPRATKLPLGIDPDELVSWKHHMPTWLATAANNNVVLQVNTAADGQVECIATRDANGAYHGVDGPACVRFDEKMQVYYEVWYKHGVYHRDPNDGPVEWTRNGGNGSPVEHYFENDKFVPKPVAASAPVTPSPSAMPPSSVSTEPVEVGIGCGAILAKLNEMTKKPGKTKIKTVCWPNGNMKEQWFLVEGKLHRTDGPAHRKFYGNGDEHEVEHWTNGKMHNPGRTAAHIRFYKNRAMGLAQYTNADGKLHNVHGPAEIYLHEDGSDDKWAYYKDGLLHRDPTQGPAVKRWIEGMTNPVLEYWVDGKQVDPPLGE